jgi:hypothetical protein
MNGFVPINSLTLPALATAAGERAPIRRACYRAAEEFLA